MMCMYRKTPISMCFILFLKEKQNQKKDTLWFFPEGSDENEKNLFSFYDQYVEFTGSCSIGHPVE